MTLQHKQKIESVTAAFCGDPGPGRSALDGWQPIGDGFFRDLEKDRIKHRKSPPLRPSRRKLKSQDMPE